jgi:hypothetical protein
MAHPFEKMFDKALSKSSPEHNEVLVVAEKIKEKGYSVEEISAVLKKLQKSHIQKEDIEIFDEALEEFSEYLED